MNAIKTGLINHLLILPQGKPEASQRLENMVTQMDEEGFGFCTYTIAYEVVCPQDISILNRTELNRKWLWEKML